MSVLLYIKFATGIQRVKNTLTEFVPEIANCKFQTQTHFRY